MFLVTGSLANFRAYPFTQRIPQWTLRLTLLALMVAPTFAEEFDLPKRNLVIEWRQIDESLFDATSQGAGATVATSRHESTPGIGTVTVSTQRPLDQQGVSQQLRVINGGRATVRVHQNIPAVWVQSAQTEGSRPGRPGTGVSQTVTWLDAGRELTLQPRWRTGMPAAEVEVHVEQATIGSEDSTSASYGTTTIPIQNHSQTMTTVLAPLGRWVTIARSGEQNVRPAGTWSTATGSRSSRQLMQIRVMVP